MKREMLKVPRLRVGVGGASATSFRDHNVSQTYKTNCNDLQIVTHYSCTICRIRTVLPSLSRCGGRWSCPEPDKSTVCRYLPKEP